MISPAMNYSFYILLLLHTCCASERTLSYFLNPGCEELCSAKNVTTVYLRADGTRDSLHYLWDFVGNPSVLLAVTSPSAKLNINWDDYLVNIPQSVNFTEEPLYTFGIVLQQVFEFDDVNDTGLLNTIHKPNMNVLNTKFFKWLRKNIINDTRFVELQMDSDGYSDAATNTTRHGNVQIMLNGFCNLDHSDVTPHMLHSENSTQVDIIFNNLETNSTFSNSRFGMEILLVSEGKPDKPMSIDAKKSLDDEHTPGIFEVVELRTPYVEIQDGNQNAAAYLQWRPISYTVPTRDVTATTEIMYYPLANVTGQPEIAGNSLLYAYYGQRMDSLLVEKIKITFGSKGDGFYKKSNYTTWTFIVGYGTPPAERFSNLVIMIISIGLGLPIILILIVGVYLCFRRTPRQRNLFVNS